MVTSIGSRFSLLAAAFGALFLAGARPDAPVISMLLGDVGGAVTFSRPVPNLFPDARHLTCIIGDFEEPAHIHNWKAHLRDSGPITVDLTVVASAVNSAETGAIKATVTDDTGTKMVTVSHPPTGDNFGSLSLTLTGSRIYDLTIERVDPSSGPVAHHYKLGSPDRRLELGWQGPIRYIEPNLQDWVFNADANESASLELSVDPGQATSITATVRRADRSVVVPSASYSSFPAAISAGTLPSGESLVIETQANGHFMMRKTSGSDAGFYAVPCPQPPPPPKLTPVVASEVHDATHNNITGSTVPAGTAAHDKAIVSKPANAPSDAPRITGGVTFLRFASGDCLGPSANEDRPLELDGTAESSPFTPPPGPLSYRVRYHGDPRYEAAEGPCEPLTVAAPACTTEVINTVNVVRKGAAFKKAPLAGAKVMMLAKSTVQARVQNLLDADAVWNTFGAAPPEPVFRKGPDGRASVHAFTADPNGWAIYEEALGATVDGLTVTSGSTRIGVANTDCAPQKHMQWIATLNADGSVNLMPARQQNITGSLLTITYPQEAMWQTGSQLYPFIFWSDSTWDVNVCAEVPPGYRIAGVYDAGGNLTAAANCVQTIVALEDLVVAFEVVEVGSPEPHVKAKLKARSPGGKHHDVDLEVPGKRNYHR